MSAITKKQYEELCEAKSFDRDEFHKLLNEYCGIEARPYTGYSYYDNAGNYIGDANDCDVKDLLDNAYIKTITPSNNLERILVMPDSREKLIKLSDFMLRVAVGCYEWFVARTESQRLQANGIDF